MRLGADPASVMTAPYVPPAWGPDGSLAIRIETPTASLATRLFSHRGEPVLLLPDGPGFGAGYLAPVASMLAVRQRPLLLDPRGSG